jgi:hypothetical protein
VPGGVDTAADLDAVRGRFDGSSAV